MPKNDKKQRGVPRHDPLDRQLTEDNPEIFHQKQRNKKKKTAQTEEVEEYVSESLSRKILDEAKKQLQENGDFPEDDLPPSKLMAATRKNVAFGGLANDGESDTESEAPDFYEDPETYLDDVVDISPEDEAALAMFMGNSSKERRTLADIIDQKFAEKTAELDGETFREPLDPKVVEVYQGVATILSRYRSGKLPKAFKIIPALRNWEDVLYITNPPGWSAQAMFKATRLFASNLNANMAQRFYNLVLLPCVREDIAENRKLNYHLYMALKKAVYKPGAFYKGIIIPLCESRDATLREASIIGSVISKVSIPMLHSAAALLKICEMEYTGANTVFIALLMDKKYALPLRVVESLVGHFGHFQRLQIRMPIIWHTSLLVFAQRYKTDLEPEHKDVLKEVMRVHNHPDFTPLIRRELFSKASGHSRVNREHAPKPIKGLISNKMSTGGLTPMTSMESWSRGDGGAASMDM